MIDKFLLRLLDIIFIVFYIFVGFLRSKFGCSLVNPVLVTGADSSHSKSLFNLLKSICASNPNLSCIVYDLGLNMQELQLLKKIKSVRHIITFNYDIYPAFVNIKLNAGEYAWKPLLLRDLSILHPNSQILWLDAGNIVQFNLSPFFYFINGINYYSPISEGDIQKWTHPKTIESIDPLKSVNPKFRNRNGALVAINLNNVKARALLIKWSDYALNKDIISPEGSSRDNHRQDQSLLSILYYQLKGRLAHLPTSYYSGIKIHQDID